MQLGNATHVNVESYRIGLGFTWHFDRPQAARDLG